MGLLSLFKSNELESFASITILVVSLWYCSILSMPLNSGIHQDCREDLCRDGLIKIQRSVQIIFLFHVSFEALIGFSNIYYMGFITLLFLLKLLFFVLLSARFEINLFFICYCLLRDDDNIYQDFWNLCLTPLYWSNFNVLFDPFSEWFWVLLLFWG